MNKGKVFLCTSIGSFFVMSSSFLIMPLVGDFSEETSFMKFVPGILFWIFLLQGGIMTVLFGKWRKSTHKQWTKEIDKRQYNIGIISLFRSKLGLFFDIFTIIMFIVLIICLITTDASVYKGYVFCSLFVFGFCMHCIFNGRNYLYFIEFEKHMAKSKKNKNR